MKFFIAIGAYYSALLFLSSCNTSGNSTISNAGDTIIYKYKAAHYLQNNDKIKDTSLLFRASIYYPEFDEKQNKNLADSLYAHIQYSAFKGCNTAEEATKAFVDECIKQTKEEFGLSMLGWESIDSVTVVSNTPNTISLRRMHYSYTGGAHGNPSETYTSFKSSNGKRLKLDDIIQTGKILEFKAINIAHLKKSRNIKEQSTLEDVGLFVSEDDLPLPSSFALTRQGLLLAYDYYEIASYADGVISYTIPFSMLKGVLKSEYIITE